MFLTAEAPWNQNVSKHKMCSKDFALWNIQQLISIKAQVVNISAVKVVKTQYQGQLKRQDVYKFHYTHSLGILDNVRILNCKQFDPRSTIWVKFTDDDGTSEQVVDLGGPLRQFPCLLLQASILQSRVFQGPEDRRVLFTHS